MTGPAADPGPGEALRRFGFSAVVGHDDLKLALLVAAIDPAIGGVLLRGDKGSGKTTLARGLASLLSDDAPFVELPLGATEDRVLGSIDIGATLTRGSESVRRGLLADADGGVLYVDEINLLPDHLVDTLLDVAATGEHRLERDGISVVQPSRFVLVGTMNPEEGELRPQLLDRFGLCVTVSAPDDPDVRAEIVRRRLSFDGLDLEAADGSDADVWAEVGRQPRPGDDGDEDADAARDQSDPDAELRARLAAARPARLGDEAIGFATRLAVAVGAEGVRADLVLCRAAAALAGWEGRPSVAVEDVEAVAPLVLAHRRRRSPFEPPSLPPEELLDALGQARGAGSAPPPTDGGGPPPRPADTASAGTPGRSPGDRLDGTGNDRGNHDHGHEGPNGWSGVDPGRRPVEIGPERAAPRLPPAPGEAGRGGHHAPLPALRGRAVRDEAYPPGGTAGVAVAPTVRGFARRRGDDPGAVPEPGDLRAAVHEQRAGTLIVIALDTSGSMGAHDRIRAATGAVMGLLTGAYQRRDRVAVVTFAGAGARLALAPTGSVEVARARLASLETGGTTPLAAGLTTALSTALGRPGPGGRRRPAVLVVVTDGRATGDGDPAADALAAAAAVRAAGVPALVLDAETGTPRLGLAARLAEAMGATCRPLDELTPATLSQLAASPS